MHIDVSLCACADGSMLSVRVFTQRMRWNKLLMKALHAHPVPHMFQNLWVSLKMSQFQNEDTKTGFKNIHRKFLYVLMHFLCFSTCFSALFTVVESAIMASIKIKEPG